MSEIAQNDNICPYCKRNTKVAVPAHHLLAGTVLNGKFLLGSALGEGGFGITYIGRDLNLDIKIAVKEYYPNGYVNRSNTTSLDVTCSMSDGKKDFFLKGRERFLNEARILARFASESGVVSVRDFFEANNTAYIVMEYLEGMDLKEYVKRNGLLSADEAVNLIRPVMHALKKIHASGLIHRDISPDNIRLVSGSAKLLDFGAARDVSDSQQKSLSVMLKPGYAPEEQYRSRGNQGPWTDVYALSATIYKCITGITPDDSTQRLYNDDMKLPSQLGARISPAMESVLMKGMAVRSQNRYQTIDELMVALEQAKNSPMNTPPASPHHTITVDQSFGTNTPPAPSRSNSAPITGVPPYQEYKSPVSPEKKKKSLKLTLILILIGIILIGGIACWIIFSSSDSKSQDSYEDVITSHMLAYETSEGKLLIETSAFNFSYDTFVSKYAEYLVAEGSMKDDYGNDLTVAEAKDYLLQGLEAYEANTILSLNEQFGSDWSHSIKVTHKEDVTGSEMEEALADYNDALLDYAYDADDYSDAFATLFYDSMLDSSQIEKMIYVEIDNSISGSLDSVTTENYGYMVMIDSEWYVLNEDAVAMFW